MKQLFCIVSFAALALFVAAASAQVSIGLFADPGSASCNITAPQYTPTSLYINITGAGTLSPQGISAAEFKVVHTMNIGVDVLVLTTPNPTANVALGNPMTGGCNIAFPTCKNGASINLYEVSIIVLNPANVDNKLLSIAAHGTPSSANFMCPLVNKCDVPVFRTLCVVGGEAWLNSGTNCTVAVSELAWGAVKNLFH